MQTPETFVCRCERVAAPFQGTRRKILASPLIAIRTRLSEETLREESASSDAVVVDGITDDRDPAFKRSDGLLARLAGIGRRIDQALAMVGWAALLLIMSLLTADVFCRYFFNSPISWAFDLIALYLMACVFFFGLADTLRHNENVAVDIVYRQLGGRAKAACDVVIYIAALGVFGVLFYVTLVATLDSFARREVMAGLIPWPVWAGYLLAPLGTFPAAVLSAVRLVLSIIELVAPRGASGRGG